MSLRKLVLFAIGFAPMIAVAAPLSPLPGTWVSRMSLPNVPPQVQSEMDRMLPEFCIRKGETHPPLSPQARADHCRMLSQKPLEGGSRVVYACRARGQSFRVQTDIRVAPNRKSFVEHTRVLRGPGAGMGETTISNTWVGPRCPVQRTR